VKRRRVFAGPVLLGANAFFFGARAPLRAILATDRWQEWEVECFRGLHGAEGFAAFAERPDAMGAEELPGASLTDFLDTGKLTPEMAAAAARELRRAHAWISPITASAWSHGDAHAGNFVIENRNGQWRARIIDFELRHLISLPAEVRHADDLLGFLLDLVGRIRTADWLPCAEAFLSAYGNRDLVRRLPELLLPRGEAPYAQLWRRVQTGFLRAVDYERAMRLLLDAPFLTKLGEPIHAAASLSQPSFSAFAPAQPSELVATTHSDTGAPPSRCS
jgi:hypothetical protein